VAVSGNGTYNTPAPQFAPTQPGNYHWVAAYSGSSPNTNAANHNVGCADTNEDVVVSTTATVAGASPKTVSTSNTTAVTTSGLYSWLVSYDSTNNAQRDIPASCHETSALTVANGGTISSP
jgi:hypothetical protein